MDINITATEAVRTFSEILNSVRYKGDSYIILRGGKPVAAIRPANMATKVRALKDLREFVKHLPHLEGDDQFASDMEKVICSRPPIQGKNPWE